MSVVLFELAPSLLAAALALEAPEASAKVFVREEGRPRTVGEVPVRVVPTAHERTARSPTAVACTLSSPGRYCQPALADGTVSSFSPAYTTTPTRVNGSSGGLRCGRSPADASPILASSYRFGTASNERLPNFMVGGFRTTSSLAASCSGSSELRSAAVGLPVRPRRSCPSGTGHAASASTSVSFLAAACLVSVSPKTVRPRAGCPASLVEAPTACARSTCDAMGLLSPATATTASTCGCGLASTSRPSRTAIA